MRSLSLPTPVARNVAICAGMLAVWHLGLWLVHALTGRPTGIVSFGLALFAVLAGAGLVALRAAGDPARRPNGLVVVPALVAGVAALTVALAALGSLLAP